MNQSQVILRFLFPSSQDAAEAIHPTVGPLHNPATSLEACLSFDSLSFLTACFYVGRIAKLLYQITHRVIIITFVQTHTLRISLAGLGTLYRNTLQSSIDQFAIMPIRSINHQTNRYAIGFSKQTSFDAFFGPIRRVWAGFFPHLMGLWSWLRPWIAKTNRCLSIRRSLPRPFPRVPGTRLRGTTLETASGLCYWNKYRSRLGHSIDNRFAAQKIFRPSPFDPTLWACRRQNGAYSYVLAVKSRFFSIIRPKSYTCSLFSGCSSLNPFKGTIAFEYIGNSGVIRIGSKEKLSSTPWNASTISPV